MKFVRPLIAAVICVAVIGLLHANAIAQLSGPDRDRFIKSSINSCKPVAQKNNPTVSQNLITAYCICMANGEADFTTPDDMAYLTEHKVASEDYKNRIGKLVASCKAAAAHQ